MMPIRYLDWAASAPPYLDILESSAEQAAAHFANPSSLHTAGKEARAWLEASKGSLALSLGVQSDGIVMTSGGTESDSIVLLSALLGKGQKSIVISAIEHAAVFEQARVLEELGVRVAIVRPDADGIVQPDAVASALRSDTAIVSIMAVNNETGAVQPIRAIASAVRAASKGFGRVPFIHSDAVQAFGKVAFNPAELGIDGASFSAHKLGGPRGVGALYLGKPLRPLAQGGGQEHGQRPGTHNAAGTWAFAEAARRAMGSFAAASSKARDNERALIEGLRSISGAVVIPESRAPGDERFSPYIVSASFPGLGGETMARILDDAGIAVSTGAACSAAKKDRRILDAMGVPPELSFASIRVSTGRDTAGDDIIAFLEAASSAYNRFRI